jgi:hypothetical protein
MLHHLAYAIAFALVGCSQGSGFTDVSPAEIAPAEDQQSADNSLTDQSSNSDSDWHVHMPTEVSGMNLVDCVAVELQKEDDFWVCNTDAPDWAKWKFEVATKRGRVSAQALDCLPGVCDFRVQMPSGSSSSNSRLLTTPPGELPALAAVTQPATDARTTTVQRSTNGLVFPTRSGDGPAIQTTGTSSFYFGRAGGIAVECQHSSPSQPIAVSQAPSASDAPTIFTMHFPNQNEVATLLEWQTSQAGWWEIRCEGAIKVSFL